MDIFLDISSRIAARKAAALHESRRKEFLLLRKPSRLFLRMLFERFTEEAMKAIMLAEEDTRRFGHVYVATDHILVGLLLGPENIAAKVLESIGINAKDVRVEAIKIVGQRGFNEPIEVENLEIRAINIPFGPRAKHILELSYEEARKLGHDYIGCGHLLLGMLSDERCLAAQSLANCGANASNMRTEVIRMMAENNNETVLERSCEPNVVDDAQIDEEVREREKKINLKIQERYKLMCESPDFEKAGLLLGEIKALRGEIYHLQAKKEKQIMWSC
ncbi:Clp N-terminal domain superfamily [Arabidopsis suecica]|uniref:Clp N-terminal domain superfamily n=2 Tax=Arabidopsis suecica TaxID=45249 RepID=A0A8T2CJU2_ARASU|nr:Clp N-terminal domain superfamily [Arabidopsis suecica]